MFHGAEPWTIIIKANDGTEIESFETWCGIGHLSDTTSDEFKNEGEGPSSETFHNV